MRLLLFSPQILHHLTQLIPDRSLFNDSIFHCLYRRLESAHDSHVVKFLDDGKHQL